MARLGRILGTLLIAGGALTLVWVVVVWRWQDPFTALYTHLQQSRLAHQYERKQAAYRRRVPGGNLAAVERVIAREAAEYRKTLHTGDAVGRLRIGRIGLDMVVVEGTDHDTLKNGPGHYEGSALPGSGHLVYVAGHRTTYLAPFAYIDDIRAGDYVRFEVPYGTFTYRVTRHFVVGSGELGVLRDHGREVLRLQACHPRFFATHRYLVDAALVAFTPRGGSSFRPASSAPGRRAGVRPPRGGRARAHPRSQRA